jgi:HlyD family secretion protein
LAAAWTVVALASAFAEPTDTITSLGRIEPKDGVMQVAGPSSPGAVLGKLLIDEGDRVDQGQRIAIMDTYALHKAETTRLEAELTNAARELARVQKLHHQGVTSDSALDSAEATWRVAKAALEGARAQLALDIVRSPITGSVLKIHTYTGERVGPEGIAELGRTDEMYAIAEVYETDVRRVHPGQRARIMSPALFEPIEGTVERIGGKIGKMDVLSTDPAARTDARVVEVEIQLDQDEKVAGFTNLQVHVEIIP